MEETPLAVAASDLGIDLKDGGRSSRLLFESLFPEDYKIKIDNRTPSEIAAGISADEAKELR